MKTRIITALSLLLIPFSLFGQYRSVGIEKAEKTIASFKLKDAKFEGYLEDAYGYVVFPSVGKGATGIGGAFGRGTVFEQGKPIGKAKLTQLTVGLQFGGQSYSQLILFESKADLIRFKKNKLELAAQASAVALDKGRSSNLAYNDGVAVFTITKGGLMYEAAIGGQKIKFKPYKDAL